MKNFNHREHREQRGRETTKDTKGRRKGHEGKIEFKFKIPLCELCVFFAPFAVALYSLFIPLHSPFKKERA
jgi:hypothetical protein